MNPNPKNPTENDNALSQVLREWKTDAPLPPRFHEQVWQRIASEEIPAISPMQFLRNWFAQLALRPAFATVYATLLLLIGLTAGWWQGRANSERVSESLGSRYVQMVDPYQMPRH